MTAIHVAYVTGVHRYSFGYGRIAEVIGIKIIETSAKERVCLHVRYDDGQEDFVSTESLNDGTYIFVHKNGSMLNGES